MIQIQEAQLEDAAKLGQIQIDAWLHNYPNPSFGITEEDIRAKTDEWRRIGDERIINKLNEPDTHTWVAKDEGEVVGFIGIKKEKDVTQIEALFVSPHHQKKGIGSSLMKHVLSSLPGSSKVTLEVLSHNQNAINFYKSFGFVEQGIVQDNPLSLPSGKVLTSILMSKVSH